MLASTEELGVGIQIRRNKVYVYYYDSHRGKQVFLPRERTRHLDGQSPETIAAWYVEWQQSSGVGQAASHRSSNFEAGELTLLWNDYQLKRKDRRGRDTAQAESTAFHNFIVPFFVGQHQKKSPKDWTPLIPAFELHLSQELGLREGYQRKILRALARFGTYLIRHGKLSVEFRVEPPATVVHNATPLKARLSPEELLAALPALPTDCKVNLRLIALLGYFAGLGPGELLGLTPANFYTGQLAVDSAKTYAGFVAHGLGSKLAVAVTQYAKNDYRYGVVCVWSTDAARLIATELASLPREERLVQVGERWMHEQWARHAKSVLGVTLHDLRRASCHWLGRVRRVPPTLLQEHMRHSNLQTTLLYMRDPLVPELAPAASVDWDDVG